MIELEFFRLSVPFIEPFVSATGTTTHRELVLIAHDTPGIRGWGEAGAWPGQTDSSSEELWAALSSGRALKGAAESGHLSDAASAGIQATRADSDARSRSVPLWQHLGGTHHPIIACVAVGLFERSDDLLARVGALVGAGYRSVKLKIKPGHDLEPFRMVRSAFPDLQIGVDGNGGYAELDDGLVSLAKNHPAYVEQPFAAGHDGLSAELRATTGVVVVADEEIFSIDDAHRVIHHDAADMVTVKLGRVGLTTAVAIVAWARAEGVGVKLSGLFETSIGKAHTISFAMLDGVDLVDFSPTAEHLAYDVVDDPWELVDGLVHPRRKPGIGVTVNEESVRTSATDTVRLTRSN